MALPPLNLSAVVPIYQHYISEMIEEMGKGVRLVFEPSDYSNRDDDNLPNWVDNTQPERQTEDIKALIDYQSSDAKTYGVVIEQNQTIVQIKTYLTHASKLKACEYIEPSVDVHPTIVGKYKLVRGPIPQGLKEEIFCISFWEQIE